MDLNKYPRLQTFFPSLCHLATDTAQGSLAALLPLFITTYGLSYEQAAAIMFFNTALASVAQPFFGYLADKKSFWIFIPFGIFMCGISISGLGFVNSYAGLILFSILAGLGSAIFHPEAARWVNNISPEHKGRAMGLFSVGGNGGFAVGPILAGGAYIWGPHALIVFGIINTALALFYLIAKPYKFQGERIKKVAIEEGHNDWKKFGLLFVIIAGRSINFAVLNTFIPIYWISHLMQSTATGNFALSLFFFCGVVVTLLGGILADKLGFVKVIRICYILLVPIMILFTHSDSYWLSMALLVPLAFGVFAQYSPIVVLGQQYLSKSIGFASGITLGLGITLGGIVAPLVGKLADSYGVQQALTVLDIVCVVSLIFSFLIKDVPVSTVTATPKQTVPARKGA